MKLTLVLLQCGFCTGVNPQSIRDNKFEFGISNPPLSYLLLPTTNFRIRLKLKVTNENKPKNTMTYKK